MWRAVWGLPPQEEVLLEQEGSSETNPAKSCQDGQQLEDLPCGAVRPGLLHLGGDVASDVASEVACQGEC